MKVRIRQATKKGYIELSLPGIYDASYPNSKSRRGRVQGDGKICPSICTLGGHLHYVTCHEKG